MKFNCGLTREEKDKLREAEDSRIWNEIYNYITQWHDWFAWYPVRVGSKDCRWLETVERLGTYYPYDGCNDEHYTFVYKAKQ